MFTMTGIFTGGANFYRDNRVWPHANLAVVTNN